jgi:SynChlorMet cassette protein ScmD
MFLGWYETASYHGTQIASNRWVLSIGVPLSGEISSVKDQSPTVTNAKKPMANPFVVLREEFDDWAILFNPDTGHGFGLNPTGVNLWKLLDGEHTMDTLLEKIHEQAEDVPVEARDHFEAFVDALAARGLAGSDRLEFGLGSRPEKPSSPPPGALNEVTPFKYEPPRLVDLNSEQAAGLATCTNTGSQATTKCGTGHLATCCNTGNGETVGGCCTGYCPSGNDPCCAYGQCADRQSTNCWSTGSGACTCATGSGADYY